MPKNSNNKATELFDEAAADWDKPLRVELAKGVARSITNRIAPTRTMTAMEFGCGTGLVTALLAPHLQSVLATDISTGMLKELDKKIKILQIDNITTKSVDLTREPLSGQRFQLIFSSMTLHHVEDIDKLMRTLHDHLTPGGRIALADLAREDGTFHSDSTGVAHLGFSTSELLTFAEAAGFIELTVETAHVIHKEGNDGKEHDYPVLLLSGKKETR